MLSAALMVVVAVAGTQCDSAYLEVYNATEAGVAINPPVVGPLCDSTLPGNPATVTVLYVAFAVTCPRYPSVNKLLSTAYD